MSSILELEKMGMSSTFQVLCVKLSVAFDEIDWHSSIPAHKRTRHKAWAIERIVRWYDYTRAWPIP